MSDYHPLVELLARAENATKSSNTTKAASAATTAAKKKAPKFFITTSKWYWYTVSSTIFFFTLLYLLRLFTQRAQRKSALKARGKTDKTWEGTSVPPPKANSLVRFKRAGEVLVGNFVHLRSFSLGLYQYTTVAEVFWTVAYLALISFFALYKTYKSGTWSYQDPTGIAASIQVPLIIGLASRNNVISYLTGISYQNLNYLHRASGRACVLFSWVHTFGYVQKGLGSHGPGTHVFWTGVVAFIALNFVMFSSFAIVRRAMYEFFLLFHIVFILLFIVMLYLHRPPYKTWMWPGFVLWGADRFASGLRMVIINKIWLLPFKKRRGESTECKVELLGDGDVVRLTVPRPFLHWSSGQHALITMPTIALLRYEQHPFSFANVPGDEHDPAVFIIRAHTGFTKRLVDHLQTTETTSIPCYLDGPYGISHSYDHHDTVLLIAGGTGITHVLSIFLSILHSHKHAQSAVRHLRLIWNIRHLHDLEWIAPLLNSALTTPHPGLSVHIDIHLTKGVMADEPDMTGGITELLSKHHHELSQMTGDTSALMSPPLESPESRHVARLEAGAEGALNEKPPAGAVGASGSNGSTGSGGSSTNVSRDNLQMGKNNKIGSGGILPRLTPDVLGVMSFHPGRARLERIIDEDIKETRTTMGISICGPGALALDTRKAVRAINTAARVMDGQAKIELSIEKFGW